MKLYRVKILDKEFNLSTDDLYLENVRVFESYMVSLFKSLITKNDIVLDVGANIGCTALLFSQLAHKVFAFEPCPSTFYYLSDNIIMSNQTNINTFNIGLGNKEEYVSLTYNSDNRSGGFVSNKLQASKGHITEQVKIRTLDNVHAEFGFNKIDFIKIDVEGFEKHVLMGAKNAIQEFKPTVVLELNHWCLNAFQRICVPDFFDYLKSIFPILYAIDNLNYLNIYDSSDAYTIMYRHIIHRRFNNIVCCFDESKLSSFKNIFTYREN